MPKDEMHVRLWLLLGMATAKMDKPFDAKMCAMMPYVSALIALSERYSADFEALLPDDFTTWWAQEKPLFTA